MTRDEKIEAMAREWCMMHKRDPDHHQLVLKHDRPVRVEPSKHPLWESQAAKMARLLHAIGE